MPGKNHQQTLRVHFVTPGVTGRTSMPGMETISSLPYSRLGSSLHKPGVKAGPRKAFW